MDGGVAGRRAAQANELKLMRIRLDRLRRAIADIVLCRGRPPYGSFHTKAFVIDRRVAFVGSANLTYAADNGNEEQRRASCEAAVLWGLTELYG